MSDVQSDGIIGWVLAGVATIIATLSTAVTALYRGQISDLRDQLTRLDVIEHDLRKEIEVCKTDREDLRVMLAKIQTEQEIMKTRITAVEQTTK